MKYIYQSSDFDFLLNEDSYVVNKIINEYTYLKTRIGKIDGTSIFGTANIDNGRINIEINNNKITKFTYIG